MSERASSLPMGAKSPGGSNQLCDWSHEAPLLPALQHYNPPSPSFETSDEETSPFDRSIQDQIDPALNLQSPFHNASKSQAPVTSQALTTSTSMSTERGRRPSGANPSDSIEDSRTLKDLPRLGQLNGEVMLMVLNSVATPFCIH
jgi:hypothetical protein